MEGAIETKRLFAFLMQRQVKSITNVSETTVISSGPAGKAENYFLFCFLRKLHCVTCGSARVPCNRASFQQTQERRCRVRENGRSGRRKKEVLQIPRRAKRLPDELKPTRRPTWEGALEGSCQCYRDGTFDFRLGAGLFQAAPNLAMLGR